VIVAPMTSVYRRALYSIIGNRRPAERTVYGSADNTPTPAPTEPSPTVSVNTGDLIASDRYADTSTDQYSGSRARRILRLRRHQIRQRQRLLTHDSHTASVQADTPTTDGAARYANVSALLTHRQHHAPAPVQADTPTATASPTDTPASVQADTPTAVPTNKRRGSGQPLRLQRLPKKSKPPYRPYQPRRRPSRSDRYTGAAHRRTTATLRQLPPIRQCQCRLTRRPWRRRQIRSAPRQPTRRSSSQ